MFLARSLHERERKPECRPFAFQRCKPDLPTHRPHERANEIESESRTARAEPERIVSPEKFGKNFILIAERDTDTAVFDLNSDEIAVFDNFDICHPST